MEQIYFRAVEEPCGWGRLWQAHAACTACDASPSAGGMHSVATGSVAELKERGKGRYVAREANEKRKLRVWAKRRWRVQQKTTTTTTKKVVLSFLSMTEEYLCWQCQNEWMLCWRVCVRGRESEWKIGQDSQRQTKRERHKREWKNSYVGLSLNPNARAEQGDNKAVGVCEPVSFHGLAFQIDTHPVHCYLNSQCTGIQTNQVQTNYPVTVSSHE